MNNSKQANTSVSKKEPYPNVVFDVETQNNPLRTQKKGIPEASLIIYASDDYLLHAFLQFYGKNKDKRITIISIATPYFTKLKYPDNVTHLDVATKEEAKSYIATHNLEYIPTELQINKLSNFNRVAFIEGTLNY